MTVCDPSSSLAAAGLLETVVERSADAEAGRWFAQAVRAAADADLLAAYAGAGRRLRRFSAGISPSEAGALEAAGLPGVSAWGLDRVARAALLLRRAATDWPATTETLTRLYRTGDNDERIALLGTLPALADGHRYREIALEACRSNVVGVFEAIACENPYPARHFDDPMFNSMVLKAIFLAVAVRRIDGLESRANAELARMARAYASELAAAGRAVPADIQRVTSLCEAQA